MLLNSLSNLFKKLFFSILLLSSLFRVKCPFFKNRQDNDRVAMKVGGSHSTLKRLRNVSEMDVTGIKCEVHSPF